MLQFFSQPFGRRVKRATGAPRARPLRLHLEELERREVPAAIALQNSVIPLPADTAPVNANVVPNGNELQVIGAPGNGGTNAGLLGSPTTPSPLNAATNLQSAWSDWSEVPGGGATDSALGSVMFNGQLYLFAKGLGPAIFVNSTADGTSWTGWSEVPGGGLTDQALSPVVFNGQLYLFAKGLGNGIFVNSTADGTSWTGWSEVPGGGATDSALGSVVFNGQLYLFAKGLGPAIFVNSTADGTNWTGWSEVPGGGATDQALSPVVFNGQLYLFAEGLGNGIFVNSTADGTNWTGWSEVPGSGATDSALGSVVFNGQLYLFAKGLGGNGIFVNSTADGTGWTGWSEVPGGGLTDQALSPAVFNTQLYLFAKGLGNGIFVNTMANGDLTAVTQLGPFNTETITFNNGVPVGGWAQLTLYSDGSYNFVGHFHDSGIPSYNDSLVFGVVGASGTLYTFGHTGHMAGTIQSGSRDDNWDVSGTNPALAAAWSDLVQGGGRWYWEAAVNLDLTSLVDDLKKTADFVATVVSIF
jgi:hypothetical protein